MDTLLNPSIGLVFWTLIIFLLLVVVLAKFAWRPILNALHERENSIEEALRAADKAKAEMERLQADNEKLLNEAREERNQMLKEAKETRESIVNEAKGKAKAEASKIIEDAKAEINTQKLAAIVEVKNQVGALAIDIAEKVLRKELSNSAEQEKYVSQLVDDVKLN